MQIVLDIPDEEQDERPLPGVVCTAVNGEFGSHVFVTLVEARRIIEPRQVDYNTVRSHTSLAGLPPIEFAAKAGAFWMQQARGTTLRGGSMP